MQIPSLYQRTNVFCPGFQSRTDCSIIFRGEFHFGVISDIVRSYVRSERLDLVIIDLLRRHTCLRPVTINRGDFNGVLRLFQEVGQQQFELVIAAQLLDSSKRSNVRVMRRSRGFGLRL